MAKHTVFVYGTLRDKTTRERVFGKDIPSGGADFIEDYRDEKWTTPEGRDFHTIVKDRGQKISGDVFFINDSDLNRLDKYEDQYQRVLVNTAKNGPAWAYVLISKYKDKKEK